VAEVASDGIVPVMAMLCIGCFHNAVALEALWKISAIWIRTVDVVEGAIT